MARGNLEQHSPNILPAVPIFETINWFQNIFFHLFSIIKLQNFLPFWSPEKVCVNTNQVKYMPISVNAKCYWMLKKKTFCVCPLHNLCIWGAKLPLENATNARFVYILPEPLMRGRPLPALFRWGIQKHTDVPAFRRIIIPHFFFSFVARKKIEPCGAFQSRLKGINFYFVCLLESGKCDLVKALTAPSR